MRDVPTAFAVLAATLSVGAVGCIDRDPYDAGDVAAADAFHARQAAAATRAAPLDPGTTGASGVPGARTAGADGSRSVRCRCDAEGGLHVEAPADARVTRPEGEADAQAEIALDDEARRGLPLRTTKSLGFIGDGKLSQSPSRGGPWNVPDALLPPHAHDEPRYGGGYAGYAYGYGGYAPRTYARGYGHGGYGGSRSTGSSSGGGGGGGSSGGHNLNFSPHVHSSGSSYGGSPARTGGGGGARGPR